MKIKSLVITIILLISTIWSQAQQINAVPDYVFRNQVSVGRNAVTDTAAYFSIGPRYGANKGFMPPIVVDTAIFSSGKRNGLLIFSVQKNKFLYWDSVRVQWSDMAGSSGSYITGTLTTNYIPKATGSTTLGNSVMYDSSGHIRIYGNYVGNTLENRTLFTSEISGFNGYTALLKQSDSISNAGQFPLILRKGLLTSDKPRPNYGVGMETQLQDDAGTWRRSGFVVNRIVDSTAANFRTKFDFRLINGSTYPIPLIVSGDSSIRMAKLAGSGTRYVVADANGDISASSGTALVDTLTISTRAWRQKGLDSLAALEVSGSGTTNYIPKFTASSTIGNSQIFDNGTSVGIGTTSPSVFVHVQKNQNAVTTLRVENTDTTSSGARANISVKNVDVDYHITSIGKTGAGINAAFAGTNSNHTLYLMTNGTARQTIHANGRVGINTTTDAGYQLDVNGTLRTVNGANFATTSGNVGIGTTSPYTKTATTGSLGVQTTDFSAGTTGSVVFMNMGATTGNTFGVIQVAQNGDNGTTGDLVLQRFGGNVGISSTAPAYKLDINGTLRSVNGANFATTSGNVGIGTASPAAKLVVVGASSNTYISIDNAGSGENYYASNAFQQWQTAGSARMTLNSAGELLINTTTDAGDYKLQVSGNIYNTGSAVLAATGGTVGIGATANLAPLTVYNPTLNSTVLEVRGGGGSSQSRLVLSYGNATTTTQNALLFSNTSAVGLEASLNRYIYFSTGTSSVTERMRITSDGELIIDANGTDAGNYKLQVSGQAFIRNTATSGSLYLDSTSLSIYEVKNRHAILISGHSLTGAEIQGPIYVGTNWNTSSDVSAIEVALSNTASGANSNLMKLSDGTNTFRVTKDAGIFTAAPSGGTARKWKLGSVVATTVILDTANYVEVEINGVAYKLALVTPN